MLLRETTTYICINCQCYKKPLEHKILFAKEICPGIYEASNQDKIYSKDTVKLSLIRLLFTI